MKRMLIKIALVLLVVFISSYYSLKYSNYVSYTFRYNLLIDLLFRIVPGFLYGVIISYESILQFATNKARRLDVRFLLISVLLIALVFSPYLIYVFPISVKATIMQMFRTMMSYTFGLLTSLLAGYCLTQSFSVKK